MGNSIAKMSAAKSHPQKEQQDFEPVETFQFHSQFLEEINNGLYFNDIYLPEEIVRMILGYIPPEKILIATLVCKTWCNIIKSELFWFELYSRHYCKKPKRLPWYVYYALFSTKYFDTNLIKNGNGEEKFKHWNIVLNYGDEFSVEDSPRGSDPLPPDIPDFNGRKSCFATSYYECNKSQEISLEKNRLMQLILSQYKPKIYLSEWVAGRFDCGCVYTLWCKLYGGTAIRVAKKPFRRQHFDNRSEEKVEEPLHVMEKNMRIEQWAGKEWSKVEMVVENYPPGVKKIVFQHEGRDTQFWKGHYGSKMAGGVLKILFDSMEPQQC